MLELQLELLDFDRSPFRERLALAHHAHRCRKIDARGRAKNHHRSVWIGPEVRHRDRPLPFGANESRPKLAVELASIGFMCMRARAATKRPARSKPLRRTPSDAVLDGGNATAWAISRKVDRVPHAPRIKCPPFQSTRLNARED